MTWQYLYVKTCNDLCCIFMLTNTNHIYIYIYRERERERERERAKAEKKYN